jgi:hypothetical protein
LHGELFTQMGTHARLAGIQYNDGMNNRKRTVMVRGCFTTLTVGKAGSRAGFFGGAG